MMSLVVRYLQVQKEELNSLKLSNYTNFLKRQPLHAEHAKKQTKKTTQLCFYRICKIRTYRTIYRLHLAKREGKRSMV